jgi:ribosomal protein S18 acetylase RimI-like enzyme
MTAASSHPHGERDLPPGFRVERIAPDRLEEAIRVLVRGDRAAAARFLEFATSTGLPLEHVWSLIDSADRIEATTLAAPAAGRTATIFTSRAAVPARVASVGRLVDLTVAGLQGHDIDLAQALLDPNNPDEEAIFLAGGFRRLAELDYLERPIPRFGSIPVPNLPSGVEIEAWQPDQRSRLLDLLQRTYENTLDCPGLAGLRRPEDILDGHLASGRPIPGAWHLLRVDGRDAGALLLNRNQEGTTVELVYLGLAPEVRGRGLGRALLTFGLAALDDDPARTIVLAVDRANLPAVGLYRRAGFRFALRRLALVRSVRAD